MSYLATEHNINIGNDYFGNDGHHRKVEAVEYHFGNVQVKVYDSFYSKTEWLAIGEWTRVNTPKNQ